MWIFGYGSLVWKADFPFNRKVPGYIRGYVRRFWQKSEDHRGIPGKPGRVCTLVPTMNQNDIVWGVAYEIDEKDKETVMKHLDYREKDGYTKQTALFYPKSDSEKPFDMILYVATENNKFFVKGESVDKIAECILNAHGESGSNVEYLLNLAAELKQIDPECNDEHLYTIEIAVKKLLVERSKKKM